MSTEQQSSDEFLAATGKGGGNIRVKRASERLSSEKSIGKHALGGFPVVSLAEDGGHAMTTSELEKAKMGVYTKKLLRVAGIGTTPPTDFELDLWHEIVSKDTWVAYRGHERIVYEGCPLVKTSLLNDDTSYGSNLVPEWHETSIAHEAVLRGQLLPFVRHRSVPYGDTVKQAVSTDPTIVSNQSPGSAATLFDATSMYSQSSTSIFTCSSFLEVSLELLADAPALDAGADILDRMSLKLAEWSDNQIANGDGTTEPEGIFTKTGTTSVSSENGTAGSITVGDVEGLAFGLPVAEMLAADARYVCNYTMYKRMCQVRISASDARRVLHPEMKHWRFGMLGFPVSIEEHCANGAIALFNPKRYNWYTRGGPVLDIETGGRTLVLSSLAMVYVRMRCGGSLELGSACVKGEDFDQSVAA
jgi:HK97 family phage major capsid protein